MLKTYTLTLSCHDIRGIVASVSNFILQHKGFITQSAQFGDASTRKFFLRIEFEMDKDALPYQELCSAFQDSIARPFNMDWHLHDSATKIRLIIMVSKYGHCLNDLLHRYSTGTLPVEITAVISNHNDLKAIVEWHKIPFYHLPIAAGKKVEQEEKLLHIVQDTHSDLVVLARYMQILSPELSNRLFGKVINIHHSFLPGFKGAKPYIQAFDRGVKLIGATAHYVTADLDEGPIIEQEVTRVDHSNKPEELESMGRDIECTVLARAIKYHIEQRVLINGHKTVIFK